MIFTWIKRLFTRAPAPMRVWVVYDWVCGIAAKVISSQKQPTPCGGAVYGPIRSEVDAEELAEDLTHPINKRQRDRGVKKN
jgi:hypothetical protein